MPVELILTDIILLDSETISEQYSKFLFFKSGVSVLIVGGEDGFEMFTDEFLNIKRCHQDML